MTETEKLGAVIVTAVKTAWAPIGAKIKALESRIETLESVNAKALADRLSEKVRAKR